MPRNTRDRESLDRLSEDMRYPGQTVEAIREVFGISESTAYRWLRYLEEDYPVRLCRYRCDSEIHYYTIPVSD